MTIVNKIWQNKNKVTQSLPIRKKRDTELVQKLTRQYFVMLNLFQHLIKSMRYETPKQVSRT